ncbi:MULTISPECIES: hypothetical protein [Bacillus cereus group]|uniref:hypothetical protein n=1 Tax=Bacillus cereus group TaxID=86661 RepID=UPI001F594200|nr:MULTISPECIES: hypothetical protein [Bacillus cereus group]
MGFVKTQIYFREMMIAIVFLQDEEKRAIQKDFREQGLFISLMEAESIWYTYGLNHSDSIWKSYKEEKQNMDIKELIDIYVEMSEMEKDKKKKFRKTI